MIMKAIITGFLAMGFRFQGEAGAKMSMLLISVLLMYFFRMRLMRCQENSPEINI